ncbi:MAG: helix-turn-helix domain-containing protein [Terasakiella sp.]|uniref:helix-turn-helix domain-containing protein n=1 Tax=unclassified Terasakiella TaxID=2614952 RepID=UPI003B01000B
MRPLAAVKFQEFVERERTRQNLTRQELADKARVSIGVVSGLETGRNSPSMDNIIRVIEALGCRLAIVRNLT